MKISNDSLSSGSMNSNATDHGFSLNLPSTTGELVALQPGQTETRKSSCYGPGLYGGQTADGTPFNRSTRTAATTDLPLGTRIRVEDPKTGRSTTITANDRGPYAPGRKMDLSEAAVKALGYDSCASFGVHNVKVTRQD